METICSEDHKRRDAQTELLVGGQDIAEIGINTVNVLEGFQGHRAWHNQLGPRGHKPTGD